jgi:threonine dehydrogenase-like Zn-dependent dehydrogenase
MLQDTRVGRGGVLSEVRPGGLRISDLRRLDIRQALGAYPPIPGYESVGVIAEIDPGIAGSGSVDPIADCVGTREGIGQGFDLLRPGRKLLVVAVDSYSRLSGLPFPRVYLFVLRRPSSRGTPSGAW